MVAKSFPCLYKGYSHNQKSYWIYNMLVSINSLTNSIYDAS